MSSQNRIETRDQPRGPRSRSLPATLRSEETRNGKPVAPLAGWTASTVPTAETSLDKLGPVWPRILSYLAPTLPEPLSGITKQECFWLSDESLSGQPDELSPGRTTRLAIRAPALAVLMRTSIAFNHLAASVLYRTVITDNLWALVSYLNNPPAHPAIASKKELLHLIRALHIEYGRKGLPLSYWDLMWDVRCWWWMDATRASLAGSQGEHEVTTIGCALYWLHESTRDGMPPFPNLSTVTIGAIFGSQEYLWHDLGHSARVVPSNDGKQMSLEDAITFAGGLAAAILRRSPLVNYCQRGVDGPLAWRRIPMATPPAHPSAHNTVFTSHFGIDAYYHFPEPIGARNRWVLDPELRYLFTTRDVCEMMYGGLGKDERRWEGDLGRMEVEIYASAPRSLLAGTGEPGSSKVYPIALADEREEMERVKRRKRKSRKRKGLGESDRLVCWKSSLDAPRCMACNGVFLDGERGETWGAKEKFGETADGEFRK